MVQIEYRPLSKKRGSNSWWTSCGNYFYFNFLHDLTKISQVSYLCFP